MKDYIQFSKFNVDYIAYDMSEFPMVEVSVSKSETSESVYVYYVNTDTMERVTVRFSNHNNNAVQFGMQLDGNMTTKMDVLYRLGLAKREFVYDQGLSIWNRQVAKLQLANYEEAELTIQEMYALGAGADLSQYTGKLAKGSNLLILGDKVGFFQKTTGEYKYTMI
jgi:hypothetical protein